MNETMQKLTEIMHESMPDKEIQALSADMNLLTDLGLDSLNMMMMALVVEDAFGIRFPTGFNPETVGDLCDCIEKADKQ